MATNAQIHANRQNAQSSTGPSTPEGRGASSRNAFKHGFTGMSLVLSPGEHEAYEAHVNAYMESHKAKTHEHRQLVQQMADAYWSLHQIFVQQTNTMALLTAITAKMNAEGDPLATFAAIAPLHRSLNTLGIYESRRRRALKVIQQELEAFEQTLADHTRPAPQPEIGSVYSKPSEARLVAMEKQWARPLESECSPPVPARPVPESKV